MAVMRSGWASLTDEQRNTLLGLYDAGEMDSEELGKLCLTQYGVRIKSNTLSRRLREWRTIKGGKSPQKGIKISGDENNLEIAMVSDRIRTLDDLLKESKVDLSTWEVSHFIVNTYESFRKRVDKDLTFSRGTISGHTKDRGGVTIVPLYQVKAWLVRKEPIKLRPVLEPINFSGVTLPRLQISKSNKDIRRAIILPDPQFGFRRKEMLGVELDPFHDRQALDVALQITEAAKVDDLIWLGDFLDLPDWSDKFVREVEFVNLTQPALLEGGWWLAQFRMAAPQATGLLFEGNHEKRLITALLNNMRAAWNVKPITFGGKQKDVVELQPTPAVSIPNYLSLDELSYKYVEGYPDGTYWLNEALRIEHGQIARGGHTDTVKAVVKDRSESVIFGHIHRIEMATKTLFERDQIRTVTAFSPGCLCRLDGAVPGYSKTMQWQHGIGIVEYDPKGTYFTIQPILINDGVAIYNGEYFKARDRLADLRENTGWDF